MRGKKRAPEERMSNVAGPLPPCRVCGEQAAGFHYGVNTCEACKGFFRRSLLRNGEYDCIGKGNCVIGTNRRKSCPKCRYLKCLSVGMSKDAIKTGRYTYMKRTQDTLEIKMLEMAKKEDSQSDMDTEDNSMPDESGDSTVSSPSGSQQQKTCADRDLPSNSTQSTLQSRVFTTICSTLESRPNSAAPSPSGPSSSPSYTEISLPSCPTPSTSETLPTADKPKVLAKDSSSGYSKSKSEESFASLKPPHDPNFNINSPLCTTLLSPQSAEESLDLSPQSQRLQGSPSKWSPYSRRSPMSTSSSSTSYAFRSGCSEDCTGTWQEFSDEDLEEVISSLVSSHQQTINDSNSLTEEFLQAKIQECREKCHLQTEVFGHMGAINREEYDQFYSTTGLDVDGRLSDIDFAAERMDAAIREMIAFMKLIPGFKSLCIEDQTALVKASILDLCLLGYFRGYCREDYIVVESASSYCIHQLRALYTQEYLDMIFNLTHDLQQVGLTFEMVVVLKAVCLFFPDRAILKDPHLAEHLLFKMVQCLLLLLKKQWAEKSGLMFSRIISLLTVCRTLAEEARKVLDTMSIHEYKAMSFRPILIELFFGNVS